MCSSDLAASKIYEKKNYTDSSPVEYFLKAKKHRVIHLETSQLLEDLLRMLSEKGEQETFSYIRKLKRKAEY